MAEKISTTDKEDVPVVYECPKCWAIIPYIGCSDRCPGDDSEDEAFDEDLARFQEEIKGQQCRITTLVQEAPDPEILELVPDQPGQPQGSI